MDNRLWLKPGKEYVKLVTARKNTVCHECEKPIFKGDKYILDAINYVVASHTFGKPFLKWYQNKICLKSWKGPLPDSLTAKRRTKGES